jgi:hypothetical protein
VTRIEACPNLSAVLPLRRAQLSLLGEAPGSEAWNKVRSSVDLLCTRIHTPGEADMALMLFKNRFSEAYEALGFFTHYDFLQFGKKLGIKDNRVVKIIDEFKGHNDAILSLVDNSFLKTEMKILYKELYQDKIKRLKMEWTTS